MPKPITVEQETKQIYKLATKKPHIITLMLLSAFAAMGAILMTPALPAIAKFFNVSTGNAKLVVTVFLLGYAIGQLVYGPLANRFGRKNTFHIGVVVATLGSVLSIASSPIDSFSLLILGRFLEALGASAGLVVCFTMINDFYYKEQARSVTSLLMLAFAIVPGFAITIGGVIVQYLNWQACFYFLLIYGLSLIIPICCLPETALKIDSSALGYKKIISNYWKLLKNKKLIGFAALSGLSSSCVYLFGAEGPFIGINLLSLKPATYGYLGLLPFIGTFFGSLIAIHLSKWNTMLVLKLSFLIELTGTIIMLLCFIFKFVSLTSLLLPMGIFCIGHPILCATALSCSMQQTSDTGNGSAIMNFVSMCMPVLMTFLLGISHIQKPWILPLLMLASLFLILCIYIFILKNDT